jgi:NO-binding membrane sensor protein with MHYT domain
MPPSEAVMVGWYDYGIASLSVLVAISSAYAALDLAQRIAVTRGWTCIAWWASSSLVFGLGIWAMHFTGMLAIHLPVRVVYDWPIALASYLIAAAASGIGWYAVTPAECRLGQHLHWRHNPGLRHCRVALHGHGGNAVYWHVPVRS